MQPKTLLLSFAVVAFTSCTTVYKSGQTPDDVYYSPVRVDNDQSNNTNNQDEAKNETPEDNSIRMSIRDPRWRDFDNDFSYNNSPYYYCTCNCTNYGYYYNPYYHPWPIYLTKIATPNATPRMVNLNAYSGYNSNAPLVDPKGGNNTGINWIKPAYNPTNSSLFGNLFRHPITTPVNNSSSSGSNSSSSNSTRSYSPSSSNNGSSSSGSSGSVARPKRG